MVQRNEPIIPRRNRKTTKEVLMTKKRQSLDRQMKKMHMDPVRETQLAEIKMLLEKNEMILRAASEQLSPMKAVKNLSSLTQRQLAAQLQETNELLQKLAQVGDHEEAL